MVELLAVCACAVGGAFAFAWAVSWWWLRPAHTAPPALPPQTGVPGAKQDDVERLPRRLAVASGIAGLGMFAGAWALNQWPSQTVSAIERVGRWWRGAR